MVKFSRLKKKSQNIKILSYKYHVLCKHTSGHNLMSCTYKIFPQIANKKKYSKEMEREKQKKKRKKAKKPRIFLSLLFHCRTFKYDREEHSNSTAAVFHFK